MKSINSFTIEFLELYIPNIILKSRFFSFHRKKFIKGIKK